MVCLQNGEPGIASTSRNPHHEIRYMAAQRGILNISIQAYPNSCQHLGYLVLALVSRSTEAMHQTTCGRSTGQLIRAHIDRLRIHSFNR